jgi:hypothetical protein
MPYSEKGAALEYVRMYPHACEGVYPVSTIPLTLAYSQDDPENVAHYLVAQAQDRMINALDPV